jgi:hypothetical protein
MKRTALVFVFLSAVTLGAFAEDKLPPEPLIPGNSPITKTPEEGRALAITLARHSIHAMQNNLPTLIAGRPKYANDPTGLIAAGHVIAAEFATIAAANNYWRGVATASK